MDVEVGQVLNGKYRIVRRIGAGGMAIVYEASHTGLGTPLAVKVLLSELARVPTLADRFRREARVSATLKSPHVIQVTDVDQLADGRPYLVMELLSGESLEQRLLETKSLSRERAVDIGLQILLGLECAHALGVVHRDLKPGNVFLARQGSEVVAKLLDFGIAKVKASTEFQALTRPGMVMGTPEYMAPEQAFSSDQASVQSDLYSVGVMLYEMLSGKLPAEGELPLVVAQQIITGRVKPLHELCPGLPQGLVNLVHRTLHADPRGRPESALSMRAELSQFTGELSAAGRVASAVAAVGSAPPAKLTPGGTAKVPAVPAPLTAEMSHFQAVPAAAGPPPRAPLPRTAEMPRAGSEHALAPTLPTPRRPPPLDASAAAPEAAAVEAPVRRRGGSVLLWLTLCGLLLGAGLGAIWILQVMSDPGPPPPMPMPKGYRTAPP
ncbi:MAG: serine/threonine-protein kinase [Deltaproteobacteria bacterium]